MPQMGILLLALLLVLSHSASAFSAVEGKSIAILQNNGGGHGEIGYALAKNLMGANRVTILQDPSCKKSTEPFCSYVKDLSSNGVNIQDCDLSSHESVQAALALAQGGNSWDCVIDNNNKDVAFSDTLCASLKDSTEQFFYVSSGGMYYDCIDGGCVEKCCPVKEDNACRKVEISVQSSPLAGKSTIFRPQYIYGDNTNKRSNIDWFVDRIIRSKGVPMPGDGSQQVSLTHVDDVAALMVCAIGNNRAKGETFNCGTDNMITYKQVCEEVSMALSGKKMNMMKFQYYNPKKLNKELGKPSFPFRATTFIVNPSKAKEVLGWTGATHTLSSDLANWVGQYKDAKLDLEDFEEDPSVVAVL